MQNVLNQWNDVLLEAVRQVKPGPPMVARSIAIMYTSVYDSWASYDPVAKPTRPGIAKRPAAENTNANKETAIHYAAYRSLLDQFPTVSSMFVDKMNALGLNPADTSVDETTPVGVGNKSASQVLTFRHTDGSNQAGGYADTSNYVSVNPVINPLLETHVEDIPFPARWQGLTYLGTDIKPASPKFIAPHWGNVVPFALTSGSQFRPVPPLPLASQGFLEQAKHIIETQANLTATQQVTAEYWADGPKSELPPGHWTLFTAFVVDRDSMTLDQSVKLFFAVTNAIFDASIATWEAKRFYDYCRPITAIRYLFRGKYIKAWGGPGKGTIEIKGERWFSNSSFRGIYFRAQRLQYGWRCGIKKFY
ncbi:MAG: vanadium-dependent haloperoxidase [Bacteroidota bacterium]|nr:vanadium-dependent haloperoxidase [Bacteroidota bacterium]